MVELMKHDAHLVGRMTIDPLNLWFDESMHAPGDASRTTRDDLGRGWRG